MSEDIQNTNAEDQTSAAAGNNAAEADMLGKAIGLAQQGKVHEARRLLQTVLEDDRDNEMAWMWLASTYSSDSDRLRLLQYYLDRHPESDLVSKAVLSIRERIKRRESRAAAQKPAAESAPQPAAGVWKEAAPARQAQDAGEFNRNTSPGNGVLDQVPVVLPKGEKGEAASESRLLLVAIAVIAVTVISALLWTILT